MMAYSPRPNFVLSLFRELLNTFIHSSGDDPLLARAHRLLQEKPAQAKDFTCLIPVIVGIIFNLLIQYVIGHVVMSILILETAEAQTDSHETGGEKRIPSCRQLTQTLSSLYSKGGLYLLFSGFGAACSYWTAHSSLTKLLSSLVLKHGTLRPLAYVVSSVVLAENHFFWSARTILPRDQINQVSRRRDWRRWKSLTIPALIYASTETCMSHIPSIIENFSGTPHENVTFARKSNITLSDISVSVLMLALHLVLLLPSYIALISVEASFLPQACETIIPSSSRQRGARVRELLPSADLPLRAQKAWQMIGVGRVLWCLELHGKMTLCLVCIAAIVHSILYYHF
ncbi:uncharacterized protein P174DRAFT_510974 [Aspergillus novofumigatus IBT 16806]|uniref:Uncharacterized protein n=1 Tax=Aspergillus novofumigatus (strain IBT 16806) TaxID=1392255 RepID=A0A2I1CBZ0_ASPN1|nr:uncharacterized protein P174DRAFT_510974 [Aspergillus novofumigatus IBT 16806]PKX95155.1 hypothetical protein P174DRAFT_510974 [Aspergillus novofumigatus IBT 16806]